MSDDEGIYHAPAPAGSASRHFQPAFLLTVNRATSTTPSRALTMQSGDSMLRATWPSSSTASTGDMTSRPWSRAGWRWRPELW